MTFQNITSMVSSTHTIQKETPTHLVLTLRNRHEETKKEVEAKQIKITEKQSECDKSNWLLNSTASKISNSTSSINTNSTNSGFSLSENLSTNNPEEDEREYVHVSNLEDLDVLIQDQDIHQNQQAAIEVLLDEVEPLQNQISNFDLISAHISNFLNLNGTTVVTATTTVGVGIATVASGGLFNLIVGGTAVAVSTNEFLKMCKSYFNDTSGSEHLKVIGSALENIENKRKVSKDLIEKAQKLNKSVEEGLDKITGKIDFLTNQLSNDNKELTKCIEEALNNALKTKDCLLAQSAVIQKAISSSKQAMLVIIKQNTALEKLINKSNIHEVNKDNFQQVLDEIKNDIIEILALSSGAYDHQTKANQSMMEALNLVSEIISLEDLQMKLIFAIQVLGERLQAAQTTCNEMKTEIKEVKSENQALNVNLSAQMGINTEQGIDITIAKDALKAEQDEEKFGETSVILGTNAATLTMMGVGFASFGPPGAIIAVLAAGIFVVNPAVRITHYARKVMKTNEAVKLDKTFELCANNLAQGMFDSKKPIAIQAKFTYNNAPMWGAGIYKNPWNLTASCVNYFCPDQMQMWTSKRGGYINCTIGGVQIPQFYFYGHTEYNPTYANYGAIKIDDQQQLAALLIVAVENGQIDPKTVLTFLNKMQCVSIEEGDIKKEIMMISSTSQAMEILKRKCGEKILAKNECPLNETIEISKK